jgi:AraC-like DNA-binding protein
MLKCWIKVQKTLSNLFKKYEKITYKLFKTARYLKHADYYATDKSIKEIAYEIGYEDIQSFSRFSKIEGVSPSDFKKDSIVYYF